MAPSSTSTASSPGRDPASGADAAAPAAYRLPAVGPIGHTQVTERVVTAIRAFIEENGLAPGHKLPPERIFIEQLGVSRSSLREALRVLSTIGLIEVRRGDGMYVSAAPDAWTGEATALFDATEENALRNLVETRLGIELAAAIAATARATDEDLEQLQRFLDDQERRLRVDPGYEWEPLAFELAVVEMTGNTWLYDVEVMLRDAWRSLSGDLRASVGRHGEWHSEHRAILASIRSRNVAQAQRLVVAHLSLERFEEDLASRGASARRAPGIAGAARPARGRIRT